MFCNQVGKTTDITRAKFNNDRQVYLDLVVPAQKHGFTIALVKPGTKISYVSTINSRINQNSVRDKRFNDVNSGNGDSEITGIQGTELTQYLN